MFPIFSIFPLKIIIPIYKHTYISQFSVIKCICFLSCRNFKKSGKSGNNPLTKSKNPWYINAFRCSRFLSETGKKAGTSGNRQSAIRKVIFMERNDFFKACQSHAIGKTVTVEYDSIAYYPIAYQLAYNADGTIRHTAVLRDIQSNSEIYCRLADVQNKK